MKFIKMWRLVLKILINLSQDVDREQYVKEQQEKLEAEKRELSENHNLIAEEKQHLMGELDYRARQLNEEV